MHVNRILAIIVLRVTYASLMPLMTVRQMDQQEGARV